MGRRFYPLVTLAILHAPACSLVTPLDDLNGGSTTTAAASATTVGAGGTSGSDAGHSSSSGTSGGVMGTYAAEVLLDEPVAYWRLDDAAGSQIADQSGGGHPCDRSSGVTFGAPGALLDDPAASFDGNTGYAECGDVLPFDGGAFSIELWFSADPVGAGAYERMVSNEVLDANGLVQGHALWLYDVPQGLSLSFSAYRDNTSLCVDPYLPVTPTEFHHVVAVYDGSDAILYIDDADFPLICGYGTQDVIASAYVLGKATGVPQSSFKGTLDEVAVYATALSKDRVHAHYVAARPP